MSTNTNTASEFNWQTCRGHFRRIAALINANYRDFKPEQYAKVSCDLGRANQALGGDGTSSELEVTGSRKDGLDKCKSKAEGIYRLGYLRGLVLWEKAARNMYKELRGELKEGWQDEILTPLPREFVAEFGLKEN